MIDDNTCYRCPRMKYHEGPCDGFTEQGEQIAAYKIPALAVEQQIRDTGQVGGSNEFPKVDTGEAARCIRCDWPQFSHNSTHFCEEFTMPPAAPIAPAAVAESADETVLMSLVAMLDDADVPTTKPHDGLHTHYLTTHSRVASVIARMKRAESELKIARDLIEQMRQQVEHFAKEAAEERRNGLRMRDEGNARIAELEQQLTAANLGSSMQHERYGSY